MTREQVGRILGVVLLLALMLGIPYSIIGFVVWDMDPSQWDNTARGLMVLGSFLLTCGYAVSQLPSEAPVSPNEE